MLVFLGLVWIYSPQTLSECSQSFLVNKRFDLKLDGSYGLLIQF